MLLDIVRARIHSQLPIVKGFLDTTVTYVLSREWQDLLSVYIFRLHPLPHCSDQVGYQIFGWVSRAAVSTDPECTSDAPVEQQAVYALGLLIACAVVHVAIMRSSLARYPHITDQVMAIMGMCVGWAAGDAAVKAMTDWLDAPTVVGPPSIGVVERAAATVLAAAHTGPIGSASDGGSIPKGVETTMTAAAAAASPTAHRLLAEAIESGDNMRAMLGAFGYSTLMACVIIMLQLMLVGTSVDFGRGKLADFIEEVLYALWGLTTRALTTSVLMLWTMVSSRNLLEGLSAAQRGTALHWRLLVLWASFLTLGGAALTTQLIESREAIADGEEADASRAEQDDDDVRPSAREREAKASSLEREAKARWAAHLQQIASVDQDARMLRPALTPPRTPSRHSHAATSGTGEAHASPMGGLQAADSTRAAPGAAACDSPLLRHTPLSRQWSSLQSGSVGAAHASEPILTLPLAVVRMWERQGPLRRHVVREAARQVLLLVEKVICWLAGCAWTDVFFVNQAKPSLFLALKDLAVAVALTALAVCTAAARIHSPGPTVMA